MENKKENIIDKYLNTKKITDCILQSVFNIIQINTFPYLDPSERQELPVQEGLLQDFLL